jgi:hypothetical protein
VPPRVDRAEPTMEQHQRRSLLASTFDVEHPRPCNP